MKFIINEDQIVSVDDKINPNSGSINYYEAEIEYDDSWNDLSIAAIIIGKETNNEKTSVAVIDRKMYIDKKNSGLYMIGFIGYKIENEVKVYQIATNFVKIEFNTGAGEFEVVNSESVPTPTEWEIYLAQIQEFMNDANVIINQANNLDVDLEGNILTITNKEGIEKSVDTKGEKGENGKDGEDGYTPQKGVDYWTSADKAEIENDVIIDITPILNNKADKSEIPDVSDFITEDVDNLTYYKKTTEINDDLALKQNITDNSLQTTNKTIPSAINEVNSIAKGANQALSYGNYSTMITAFNALAGDIYNVGQNVMIVTLEVPDLWISEIESTSSQYTYTTDEAFINSLKTNGYVQVGYYRLSALETQKVDLTGYARIESIPTELADLSDDSTHRLVTDTEKTTWNGKGTYSKPTNGIPKTDMTSTVQTSLGKADTAIQASNFVYDSTTETLTITIIAI